MVHEMRSAGKSLQEISRMVADLSTN